MLSIFPLRSLIFLEHEKLFQGDLACNIKSDKTAVFLTHVTCLSWETSSFYVVGWRFMKWWLSKNIASSNVSTDTDCFCLMLQTVFATAKSWQNPNLICIPQCFLSLEILDESSKSWRLEINNASRECLKQNINGWWRSFVKLIEV